MLVEILLIILVILDVLFTIFLYWEVKTTDKGNKEFEKANEKLDELVKEVNRIYIFLAKREEAQKVLEKEKEKEEKTELEEII